MNLGAIRRDLSRNVAAAVALAMALYHIYVIIPPMDFISPSLREVFRGPPTDYIFRAHPSAVRAGSDLPRTSA